MLKFTRSGKEVLLLDEEGNELILPKSEQIPQDYFKKAKASALSCAGEPQE